MVKKSLLFRHINVEAIGEWAFYDCSLQTITIGKNVKSIGRNAFDRYYSSRYSIDTIYVKAVEPPSYDGPIYCTRIYVPNESVYKYRTAQGWRGYASKIVGYDFE